MRRHLKSTNKCLKWALLFILQMSNHSPIISIFNTAAFLQPLCWVAAGHRELQASAVHTSSFSNLNVSDLRNARAIFRVLHDQSICQEALHWHRIRLVYGNIVVHLVAKASWYHLRDPAAVASCNFTASQKTVNPDVMRQMHEKLDYLWDICKVTKWTHIQDRYIDCITVAMHIWLTLYWGIHFQNIPRKL